MRAGTDTLIAIRPLAAEDRAALARILAATAVFSAEEVTTALELIDAVLDDPRHPDYDIAVADAGTGAGNAGEVAGYYCIGATPHTRGTYDLYWIAVDPASHGQGIGRKLLAHAEAAAAARGGTLVIAETSSRAEYAPTREFYIRNRYDELARIRAYYAPGDDLVIYGKYLSPS